MRGESGEPGVQVSETGMFVRIVVLSACEGGVGSRSGGWEVAYAACFWEDRGFVDGHCVGAYFGLGVIRWVAGARVPPSYETNIEMLKVSPEV